MQFYDDGIGGVRNLNGICSELEREKRKASLLDNFLVDLESIDAGDYEDVISYSAKVVQRTVQLAQEYRDILGTEIIKDK